MKKKALLLIPVSFLICSCSLFGKKDNGSDTDIPDVPPDDTGQHATKIDLDPSAPFTLKVGESRELKVSFDKTPTNDDEKIFTWELSGDAISYQVDQTNTRKAVVTGVKEGECSLKVTNTYNHLLSKSFSISVIDFDESKDYLWQYESSDRAQFGYENVEGKKAGVAEGDATLGSMTWHFIRSEVTSLQSSMGAVGFGKGQAPETHIHLETENTRLVKGMTLEAASANSLAKMTIKVGDTVYMNEKVVERASYDVIGSMSTDKVETPSSGKIQIDVYTPAFDGDKIDDPEYKAPGAFYLKSILIRTEDNRQVKTEELFNFKAMYDDGEDGIFDDLVKSSAKEVKFSRNDFDVTLEKVKKEDTSEDEKVPGYAHSNGYIEVKLNKSDEVIYKVEFQIQYGSLGDSSKTVYSLGVSKSGGAPFTQLNVSGDKTTGLLKTTIIQGNINTIRLIPSRTTNIGLDYLKISTTSGVNPTIKEIKVPEGFAPTKKDYNDGDEFDITGLADLSIIYNESGVAADPLPASELEWYDGPSYDKDPDTASKELNAGTTYVYGIFRGDIVATVSGLAVADVKVNLTLVKSASEIVAGSSYLIVGKYQSGFTCLNGSATTSDNIKSGYVLEGFALNDSVDIPAKIGACAFVVSFDSNSKLLLANANGNNVGLTKAKGELSCAKSPAVLGWNYEVDSSNRLIMSMLDQEETPKTKYFGVVNSSGKYASFDQAFESAQGEVYLYKFSTY